MSVYKAAVISDTHGILKPEVIEIIGTADLALHGGDIADQKTFDRLNEIAKVVAVRGNCDGEWARDIPNEAFFELCGRKIYMVHNKKKASDKAENADIIIYGHSHKYEEKAAGGKLWLNPGSCGARRFGMPLTMAVLEFDTENRDFLVKRIDLSAKGQRDVLGSGSSKFGDGNLQETVAMVVGDLKRGKSVENIVKARRLDRALTEQICQIYFTHQGIDVQGVLDRIEIAGK